MKALIGIAWCFIAAFLLAVCIDGRPEWRGKAGTALILFCLGTIIASVLRK